MRSPRDAYGSDGEWEDALRDWFAGQALIGLLSNVRAGQDWDNTQRSMFSVYASSAYNFADAMLAERQKGTK